MTGTASRGDESGVSYSGYTVFAGGYTLPSYHPTPPTLATPSLRASPTTTMAATLPSYHPAIYPPSQASSITVAATPSAATRCVHIGPGQ